VQVLLAAGVTSHPEPVLTASNYRTTAKTFLGEEARL